MQTVPHPPFAEQLYSNTPSYTCAFPGHLLECSPAPRKLLYPHHRILPVVVALMHSPLLDQAVYFCCTDIYKCSSWSTTKISQLLLHAKPLCPPIIHWQGMGK
jgi:hypothetical protein